MEWKLSHERQKYIHQLNRLRQGLTPTSNLFNSINLHNSIREILGEELSQKFIQEAHKRSQHICQQDKKINS
jgi:hypothetical protein